MIVNESELKRVIRNAIYESMGGNDIQRIKSELIRIINNAQTTAELFQVLNEYLNRMKRPVRTMEEMNEHMPIPGYDAWKTHNPYDDYPDPSQQEEPVVVTNIRQGISELVNAIQVTPQTGEELYNILQQNKLVEANDTINMYILYEGQMEYERDEDGYEFSYLTDKEVTEVSFDNVRAFRVINAKIEQLGNKDLSTLYERFRSVLDIVEEQIKDEPEEFENGNFNIMDVIEFFDFSE